jgi:hypothetical protein
MHGSLEDPANLEMFQLREELKPLLPSDEKKFDSNEASRSWALLQRCERAVRQHTTDHSKMAQELWGHLVGAFRNIAVHVTWPKGSTRWQTVRRILLSAAADPVPSASEGDDKEDRLMSWGWPSPRIDAAQALPFLAFRIGKADRAVATALRNLRGDKTDQVRYNLARHLAILEKPASGLMWELIDAFIANEPKFSVLDAVLDSMQWLSAAAAERVRAYVRQIGERAEHAASPEHQIHQTIAATHLFRFLQTGRQENELFLTGLIAECDTERAGHALLPLLHACRANGWLTEGDLSTPNPQTDASRARTWKSFSKLLTTSQEKLKNHREALQTLYVGGAPDPEKVKSINEKLNRAARFVDGIAMQLYFASGAFDEKRTKGEHKLTAFQTKRFWDEASALLSKLAEEPHPHTAHQLVQTLDYLLPYAPREVFLLATQSIRSSSVAGFQYESLAVADVVKLIQHALADHRDLFKSDVGQQSECLVALLDVLDLFVEAGWAEARQLTHRLEEIYR